MFQSTSDLSSDSISDDVAASKKSALEEEMSDDPDASPTESASLDESDKGKM